MLETTLEYSSSFDGTGPLLADVRFEQDGRPKPVLLIMHGYSGDRRACRLDLEQLSTQGVIAVTPDMRGRGGSAGVWDSGGLDVHDAVDAALEVVRRYPGDADPTNLNIVGYSGGGGNAIAAACRFPDLFNSAVSFFGIPDYAGWWRDNTRPDCMTIMQNVLGTPQDKPASYEARDMIPAAGNAMRTRWAFFWDAQETMCPPSCVDRWIAEHRAAGGQDVQRHVTGPGDPFRWIHNYRSGNPALSHADRLFMPGVLAGPKPPGLELPPRGELVVPGYLVTRRFRVSVGAGTRGAVRIRYRLDAPEPIVEVIDNPRGLDVRVENRPLTGIGGAG